MAATTIIQRPLFNVLPAGQPIIFTVINSSVVENTLFTRVKYVAEVYVSRELVPNMSNNDSLIGTFKTTPNDAGVGIFDIRPIVENYVSTDNKALKHSQFKGAYNKYLDVPMHLIDHYSITSNSFVYFSVRFKMEYSYDDSINLQTNYEVDSADFKLFNGYLKYTDPLVNAINEPVSFGFNSDVFKFVDTEGKFLTNAPIEQYANLDDYGTLAFNTSMVDLYDDGGTGGLRDIKISFINAAGGLIAYEQRSFVEEVDGGFFFTERAEAGNQIVYVGVFPANLRNWSDNFNNNIDIIDHCIVHAISWNNSVSSVASQSYKININCPTLKGYEPIRLTWLNQWGAWDYYTFNMKSTKSISTKGSTYNQSEGTWNEAAYRIQGFKGGKKTFRVNSTEKVTMNTGFVSEAESEWFEELINSPEIYILEGFKTDVNFSILNDYVTPVRLATSSHTRKTVANDKLIQYTFEVEKSKTLRTQSI